MALVFLIFAYAGLRPMSILKTLSTRTFTANTTEYGESTTAYEDTTESHKAIKLRYDDFEVFKYRQDDETSILGAVLTAKHFKGGITNLQRSGNPGSMAHADDCQEAIHMVARE